MSRRLCDVATWWRAAVATGNAAKTFDRASQRDVSESRSYETTPKLLHVVALTLLCVGYSPKAQAVNPAPDGGYAGGNTAEGQDALLSLTGGSGNTAVGLFSLISNLDGDFNTVMGAGTLLVTTADNNTATALGRFYAIPPAIQIHNDRERLRCLR